MLLTLVLFTLLMVLMVLTPTLGEDADAAVGQVAATDIVASSVLTRCPRSLKLNMYFHHQKLKPMTIPLHRTRTLPTRIPVQTVTDSGGVKMVKFDSEVGDITCSYCNPLNRAIVTVWRESLRSKPSITASFLVGPKAYQVSPMEHSPLKGQIQSRYIHSLHVAKVFDDVRGWRDLRDSLLRQSHEKKLHARDQAPEIRNLTVELAIGIGFSIYSKMKDKFAASDAAIKQLRYRYAHVVNDADYRFTQLPSPSFRFKLALTGFVILTDEYPFWMLSHRNEVDASDENWYLNGDAALGSILTWREKQAHAIVANDHLSMFTDRNLYRLDAQNQIADSPIGIAFMDGMCGYRSVSVIETRPQFAAGLTLAHELAHNMGSSHDGSNNNCDASDQFVMSPSADSQGAKYLKNIYHFSSCSVAMIHTWARRQLQSVGEHFCLLNAPKIYDKQELLMNLALLPGQKYSLDQQCQSIEGEHSYFCGATLGFEKLCQQIACQKPKSGQCSIRSGIGAATGTSCGNKKWCIRKQCMEDDDAPEKDESCFFGDYTQEIPIQTMQLSCSDIKGIAVRFCYNEGIRSYCCESCRRMEVPTEPDCLYGDKAHYCSTLERRRCYNENTRSTCCRTCRVPSGSVGDCIFGDRIKVCKESSFSGAHCYTTGNKCCQTCLTYSTGIPGCEYGDRNPSCGAMDGDRCSSDAFRNTCCHMCATHSGRMANMGSFSPTERPPPVVETQPVVQQPAPTCQNEPSLRDTCSEMPKRYCYRPKFRERCCGYCQATKDATRPDCPYGDRHSRCLTVDISRCSHRSVKKRCCQFCITGFRSGRDCSAVNAPDCYDRSIRSHCREKCTSLQISSIPDCQFGDRSTTCDSYISQDCYKSEVERLCCLRCSSYDTSNSQCRYGDHQRFCTSIAAAECYYSETRTLCCHTCASLKNINSEGCEYGDRPSCPADLNVRTCANPDVWDACCRTCPTICKDKSSRCNLVQQIGRCYKQAFYEYCCNFCRKKRDLRSPQCEYGDRNSNCEHVNRNRCTEPSIQRICCITCYR